jgi:hypothetical protein
MTPSYAKVSEIADRFRVSADAVYLWIRQGKIPSDCVPALPELSAWTRNSLRDSFVQARCANRTDGSGSFRPCLKPASR